MKTETYTYKKNFLNEIRVVLINVDNTLVFIFVMVRIFTRTIPKVPACCRHQTENLLYNPKQHQNGLKEVNISF